VLCYFTNKIQQNATVYKNVISYKYDKNVISYKYEITFLYTVASCWIFFVNYTGLVKIMLTLMDYFSPADVRALNGTVARWLLC
jgi:hypothetical protein